jgi:hypothetical protein
MMMLSLGRCKHKQYNSNGPCVIVTTGCYVTYAAVRTAASQVLTQPS